MTESEIRAARRAWERRNSDGKTQNIAPPSRPIVSETTTIPDGQLGEGQEVTIERQTHVWSVDDPDETG